MKSKHLSLSLSSRVQCDQARRRCRHGQACRVCLCLSLSVSRFYTVYAVGRKCSVLALRLVFAPLPPPSRPLSWAFVFLISRTKARRGLHRTQGCAVRMPASYVLGGRGGNQAPSRTIRGAFSITCTGNLCSLRAPLCVVFHSLFGHMHTNAHTPAVNAHPCSPLYPTTATALCTRRSTSALSTSSTPSAVMTSSSASRRTTALSARPRPPAPRSVSRVFSSLLLLRYMLVLGFQSFSLLSCKCKLWAICLAFHSCLLSPDTVPFHSLTGTLAWGCWRKPRHNGGSALVISVFSSSWDQGYGSRTRALRGITLSARLGQ